MDSELSGELEIKVWSYDGNIDQRTVPWGPHESPVQLDLEGVIITLEKQDTGFVYRRQGAGEEIEKLVLSKTGKLYLSPVEPVNKPAVVSNHLLVELAKPLMVEPQSARSIFITFPIEIAISVGRKHAGENIIDMFTFSRSKHTLYGSIKDGLICKYWRSDIFTAFPEVNPLKEGIVQLEIQNPTAGWAEVTKTVLSAQGMKIYFGENLVTLNAVMKIINDHDAETSFIDSPLRTGLTAAVEQFSTKLLSQQGKTLMEGGY